MTSKPTHDACAIEDLPERFNVATDLINHNLVAGGKAALIDYRGALSYAESSDRIDRMAGVFAALGIRREQRVLLCLLDTRDFPTVFLGAIKAGIVPVPVNTLLTAADFAWILDNSAAAAVFVCGEMASQWAEIADARRDVRFVSSGGGPSSDLDTWISAVEPQPRSADTHRDDVAFWLYTSGSTGRPKGLRLGHASLRLTAKARLAPYKYPRWIVFADALSKTATGKIQRFRLREQA